MHVTDSTLDAVYLLIQRCTTRIDERILTTSQEVAEATPCLFLVALDRDELKQITGRGGGGPMGGGDGGTAARLWLLVAWIPDDSKVRQGHIVGAVCSSVITFPSLPGAVWEKLVYNRNFASSCRQLGVYAAIEYRRQHNTVYRCYCNMSC